MSNNPNFVSELVQMAKAFEELPVVQAALTESRQQVSEKDVTIHELEGRIIDLTNALDSAREATRKAEVERDHAETMFLETDDKLQKVLGIFGHFKGEVDAYTKATEPVVVEHHDDFGAKLDAPMPEVKVDQEVPSNPPPLAGHPEPTAEPSPAINTDGQSGTTSQGGDGNSGSMDSGQREVDPTSSVLMEASVGSTSVYGEASATQQSDPGQSEPGPTATGTVGESATVPTQSVETQNAANTTSLNPGMDSSPPQDDVGYHNEPSPHYSPVWYQWANKMDDRYGAHSWPSRS